MMIITKQEVIPKSVTYILWCNESCTKSDCLGYHSFMYKQPFEPQKTKNQSMNHIVALNGMYKWEIAGLFQI